ncbi:MAG: oxygen-independent coproporphyrinogen III oxidase [Myxococcota bacterium]
MTIPAKQTDDSLRVDADLLRKYSVSGPRYTSYPTALHFDEAVDAARIDEVLAAEQNAGRPLSIYFHLPFCRKLCWYCACHKIVTGDRERADTYLDDLERELELKRPWIEGRPVTQVHLGGGTPTFFSPTQIERLGALIHRYFDIRPDAEMGVEIDPREFTKDHALALKAVGFNRASLGIQDNNQRVQEAINRVQPHHLNEQAVSTLRELGFGSLNVDLIYGLPHQTEEGFEKTLDEVLELGPDRFAIYSYAHVPWISPSQKLLETESLPGPEEKLALLKLTIETISSAGYDYIGMDHFARPDDSLAVALREGTLRRNFQGYSTGKGVDIMGFGISAISQSRTSYFQNEKDIDAFEASVRDDDIPVVRGVVLSEDDKIRRAAIMDVMCKTTVDFKGFSRRHGVQFDQYFEREIAALDELERDGLVERHADSLRITRMGRLFIRNIAMCFDDYLRKRDDRTHRYSKTV